VKRRESKTANNQTGRRMGRVEFKHISVSARNPFAGWERIGVHALFVAFVALLAVVCVRLRIPDFLLGAAHWPEGLLLVLATATTLGSLSGQIPAQNVVLAALVVAVIAGAVEVLGAITAIPFGPFVYNKANIGPWLFYPLPWAVPVIWVVAILNARGVVRLILRRHRHARNYGWWVMGLTVMLVVLFDLSLEPYATQVREYWSWKPTKLASTWYTTPWVNSLGWTVTSLLILLFVTPALINKSPVKKPPTYHPLCVWQLLSLLFLIGTTLQSLWAASALIATQMVLVLVLAWLGPRATK